MAVERQSRCDPVRNARRTFQLDEEVAAMNDYIYTDLHLHLDGSLSIPTVRCLSDMADISIPSSDTELRHLISIGSAEPCDLNTYLKCFDLPVRLLQSEQALKLSIRALTEELTLLGVDYAEVRFAPQLHTSHGLTQQCVVQAVIDGYRELVDEYSLNAEYHPDTPKPTTIRLILCLMRGERNEDENYETLEVGRAFCHAAEPYVVGLDLAGAEGLYPTENYIDIFKTARRHRIPFTIHAGEAAGPDSVWAALEAGACRIGHGIAASRDGKLMQALADRGCCLELCPTSNLQTSAVQDIQHYPMRLFMQYGIPVTINSDNMSVSGTNVIREFDLLTRELSLSQDEVSILQRNAVVHRMKKSI